jgi:hypothetical protein
VARKLLLSLASLLIAALVAEGMVRLLGAAPEVAAIRRGRFQLSPNPRLGYVPAPLVYHGDERSFLDYEGASNSLGYRDVEHALAKPPGTYRVVVLGDSIAAGLKVERFADTFPGQLERLLRERGLRAEVISLAVSGYNTLQEVETLRVRGLAYRPDVVLLAYSLTDRERFDGNVLETLLAQQSGQRPPIRGHPALLRSALYRLLRYRLASPVPGSELRSHYRELLAGDTVAPSLAELAALSREHRFAVLMAVFPRAARYKVRRSDEQHDWAMARCRENDFRCLDLRAAFEACRRARRKQPLGLDGYHPSIFGHRCAAGAMADEVLALAGPPAAA